MKLFDPITINGMEVKNRIVFPAIQLNMGMTNRRASAFYNERARGGAGLILSANTAVDNFASEELWGGAEALAGFISRLQKLTRQIHDTGAKMGVQLWQANRFPQGRGTQIADVEMFPGSGDPVAPSPRENLRELTIPEIEAIIYRFAKAARNVRDAGFDCVELHGAHAYLPCQFTAPETNQRNDKYGGDARRRMQFGIDLAMAVRAFVGPDFPLLYRLGALEKNGRIDPDSIDFARELEKAGIDCLDISTGGFGQLPVIPTRKDKMGTLVFLAEAIKKNVDVPVIGVGRINTPQVAEALLCQNQVDMVAIGRQLIADPFWPEKVREDRFDEVVACDSCNINCSSSAFKRNLPEDAPLCKNNERVGREWKIPVPE